jgi:extracellular elastinolytic metalloproteinase
MNLVIGAMMVQPCTPSFFDARDAILLTDINYYGGIHFCEIWMAFAKRGLGVDANRETYENGYSVGNFCKTSKL